MLTPEEDLTWTIEEFCNDHATSEAEGTADYTLDASTFHNWCDATGNEAYKSAVPDNDTLRRLIRNSAFSEQATQVPD